MANLARLFRAIRYAGFDAAMGVRMLGDMIVADRKRAQRVAAGRDARRALTDYILWMGLGPSEMNGDDP